MSFVWVIVSFLFLQTIFAASLHQQLPPTCNHGNTCTINESSSNVATQNTPSAPDITINHTNPSATIQLASNPTTGYTWTATSYDNSLITLSHQYVRSQPELIGSGGHDIWTITATQKALNSPSQTTTINFGYLRSWEKGKAPISVKTVVVQIN